MNLELSPNWQPFRVAIRGQNPDPPRSLVTFEGLGDRLRSAAFAEKQAGLAFELAADWFPHAALELKEVWQKLSCEEDKHLRWLLNRMSELNIAVDERIVSQQLWQSFQRCQTEKEFVLFMANAEERGRKAGFRFYQYLLDKDKVTAELFLVIAQEEENHIAAVVRFFK